MVLMKSDLYGIAMAQLRRAAQCDTLESQLSDGVLN